MISTDELTKRYGTVTALDGCTLRVEREEVFGLLGPNGAGKTTLLRILLGFLRPSSGTAAINQLNCQRDSLAVRRHVAYLPGEVQMFRRMRGRQVLRFFAQLRKGVDLNRAVSIADRLGLDTSRRVANMSTGMRQKLALAVALAPDVPLVILDEPTSNLDPNVRSDVLQLIEEVKREGRTVLFSSHVLSEVEDVCDRVAILRKGRLSHLQVISELRRQHTIQARLISPLTPPTPELADQLTIRESTDGRVTIQTPGDLSPILGWLAQQSLDEVRIEPVGLRSVYEEFHPIERRGADLS